MREKIKEILVNVNMMMLDYNGEDAITDGILDSIQILDLVRRLEDEFEIEINEEYISAENLGNIEKISNLVEVLCQGRV